MGGSGGNETALSIRPRLDAIDFLRGCVMILMALDHVRDFFTNVRFDPLDLSQTTPGLFLTRWVTHFCAPVFVFLAGTGAYLGGSRGRSRSQQARLLLTRGIWLIILEATLVHLAWSFNFHYRFMLAQVIWAIGGSMVLLAGLVYLPWWVIGALGILITATHNLGDGVNPAELGAFRIPWIALVSGGVQRWDGGVVIFAYPVLPWFGVMAMGYAFGRLWLLDRDRRRWWLLGLGIALALLFVALRALNGYGDRAHWTAQSDDLFTLLSFLNCTKYPPSLLFVLMTLGPAILALAVFDRPLGAGARPVVIFGRVPLFYYLLHMPLIHASAVLLAYIRYHDAGFQFDDFLFTSRGLPDGYGYDLPVVYLIWVVTVVVLYPPCAWFAGVKQRYRAAWLGYL